MRFPVLAAAAAVAARSTAEAVVVVAAAAAGSVGAVVAVGNIRLMSAWQKDPGSENKFYGM